MNENYKQSPEKGSLISIFPESFEAREFVAGFYGGHVALVNRALDECNIRLNGLLHLGGHAGQELSVWHLLGARKIYIVEPQSRVIETLKNNAEALTKAMSLLDEFECRSPQKSSGVKVLQAAVSDKDSKGEIHIYDHNKESSLFLSDNVTDIKGKENIDIVTIKTIFEQHVAPWNSKDFNGMWLNIQGSELKALEGAGEYVRQFEFIMLEINFVKRYENCAKPEELYDFMESSGFAMFSSYKFHHDYGYAIFIKK